MHKRKLLLYEFSWLLYTVVFLLLQLQHSNRFILLPLLISSKFYLALFPVQYIGLGVLTALTFFRSIITRAFIVLISCTLQLTVVLVPKSHLLLRVQIFLLSRSADIQSSPMRNFERSIKVDAVPDFKQNFSTQSRACDLFLSQNHQDSQEKYGLSLVHLTILRPGAERGSSTIGQRLLPLDINCSNYSVNVGSYTLPHRCVGIDHAFVVVTQIISKFLDRLFMDREDSGLLDLSVSSPKLLHVVKKLAWQNDTNGKRKRSLVPMSWANHLVSKV